MKSRMTLTGLLVLSLAAPTWAQDAPKENPKTEIDLPKIEYPKASTEDQQKAAAKHEVGSQKLAVEQDELSADVQELIDEQTSEKVIKLLEEVESFMGEVTDSLDESETGGETIAAETHIIEKIFEAAKERAQECGGT